MFYLSQHWLFQSYLIRFFFPIIYTCWLVLWYCKVMISASFTIITINDTYCKVRQDSCAFISLLIKAYCCSKVIKVITINSNIFKDFLSPVPPWTCVHHPVMPICFNLSSKDKVFDWSIVEKILKNQLMIQLYYYLLLKQHSLTNDIINTSHLALYNWWYCTDVL